MCKRVCVQGSLKYHFDCAEGVQPEDQEVGKANNNIGAFASVSVVSAFSLAFPVCVCLSRSVCMSRPPQSKTGMQVTHLDDMGSTLYTAPLIPPRKL